MSIKVMHLVWQNASELQGSRLLVMLALADWSNDEGHCWPKINQLAHKTRVSARTAQRCIRDLEEEGYLTAEGGGGRGIPSQYQLSIERLNEQRVTTLHPLSQKGDNGDTKRVTPGASPYNIEPSINNTSINPPVSPLGKKEAFEEFWQLYPTRRGKKGSKKKAFAQWEDVKAWLYEEIMVGVQNFRESDQAARGFVPDAFRWLRDELWDDWQEPEEGEPSANGKHPAYAGSLADPTVAAKYQPGGKYYRGPREVEA